jgi:hypothetical protein
MSAETPRAGERPFKRAAWVFAVGVMLAAGIILAWLGSADPPIDVRNSAYWYRTLGKIPGLTDVCGDFTWLARFVPPVLAATGAVLALFRRPRSVVSLIAAGVGIAVTVVLAFATTQNAIPWGGLHCIID